VRGKNHFAVRRPEKRQTYDQIRNFLPIICLDLVPMELWRTTGVQFGGKTAALDFK
jgi:hypothetical protein